MELQSRILTALGEPLARITTGAGPVIAVALHAGHALRGDLEPHLSLPQDDRLREEDPFTAAVAPAGIPVVEVLRSRFEVDLNRPRFRAVYTGPEDAWGLELYPHELPAEVHECSIEVYDVFYQEMHELLESVVAQHGRFVVLDLHSYNHRRDGADAPPAPPQDNPEVNLGTGWLDLTHWTPVVSAFTRSMRSAGFDCRENVKFKGGHFAHWISQEFPGTGAALAIEFKKVYMDEWTGVADDAEVARIRAALTSATAAIQGVLAPSL